MIGTKDSYEESIKEGLTYVRIRDMSFVTHVFYVALRLGNTAPGSSPEYTKQDGKFGWLNVMACDTVVIGMTGLHLNANEW